MDQVSKADLREMADELKEYVRERMDRFEERLILRRERIDAWLADLNAKAAAHTRATDALRERIEKLERAAKGQNGIAHARALLTDGPHDLSVGPTWKLLGIGIAAVISIGWGALETILWLKRVIVLGWPTK